LCDKEGIAAIPSESVASLGAPPTPVIQNIHQTVFNAVNKPDALDMGKWHVCETTHCRAGWVVHLAGEAGKALEKFHDTPLAALLIYHASSPDLLVSPTRFYEDNIAAMNDMKRLAEEESKLSEGE
jgi:hypothetical protein